MDGRTPGLTTKETLGAGDHCHCVRDPAAEVRRPVRVSQLHELAS
jgi:hypothetical protein